MENNNCFSLAENKFLQMTNFLKSNEASNLDYCCVEDYLQKDGQELLRDLLSGHIDSLRVGDVGPCVTGTDGIKRTHKRLRTKKIKTLFGEVTINRMAYEERSVPSLFPLDGMLNLPLLEVSYNLPKYLVLEIIKSSFDESIESIERFPCTKITKEQAKKIVIESAKDFNKFYDCKEVNETNIATALPLIVLNE